MNTIDRKSIKKNSHKYLKKNFFMSILIIFIFSLIMNNTYTYSTQSVKKNSSEVSTEFYNKETKKIDYDKLFNEEMIKKNTKKAKGILAPIASRLNISQSPLYNFSYSIKLIYLDKNMSAGIYSLFIAFLSLLIYFFIKLVLEIGKNRFYLESRIYSKTNALRLLFPYKVKNTFNLSIILFFRRLYQLLWSLTIIGGFIKAYEYMLIPYILAENPSITKKEAFRLSKEMMYGYKWQAFKLDLSLLGWILLGLITLGISNILYFEAYNEYIKAEFYYVVRKNKKKELTDSKLLNDKELFNEKTKLKVYPEKELKVPTRNIKINTDYNQKYPIRNIILLFFVFAFAGWLYEVSIHLVIDGRFVNRGTMFGPWLPIYGYGAILILLLLKSFRDKPHILFVSAMVLAGILEYVTHWALETFFHMKWWDYSGYFFNINGRVCLEGLIVFGLGGATVIYFIGPLLNSLFNKIKYEKAIIICMILLTLYGVDTIYSINHPNTGKGITDYK